MTKIVQIRGANGSGKTSLVKDLLALSGAEQEILEWELPNGKAQAIATVCSDIGWAAIGVYPPDKKMGGCDNFNTLDDVKQALISTYTNYPTLHGIVFEGMLITAIKTPIYEHLLKMEREFLIQPIIIQLRATLEGCVKRIEGRGTRKPGARPLNLDLLRSKIDMVERYGQYYGDYARWIDVESTPKTSMLVKFLEAVGDRKLLKRVIR
jgi:deoxyadenosine/deoxycytidine kinase